MKSQLLQKSTDPFEAFKRAALLSLLWGCSGSFLLGTVAGIMLST